MGAEEGLPSSPAMGGAGGSKRVGDTGFPLCRPSSLVSRTLALPAEVEVDRIPELSGEVERLRAILWARLALRINRPVIDVNYSCRQK